MFSSILVTLDGSPYSERVLGYVPDLAQLGGAQVTLLTVVPEDAVPSTASEDDRLAPYSAYLEQAKARLTTEGLDGVEVQARIGVPARVIVQVAREQHADLIAMSTQGLGAEHDQALGGVASKVLANAPCPVFMVRVSRPLPARGPAEERWQEEGGANVG